MDQAEERSVYQGLARCQKNGDRLVSWMSKWMFEVRDAGKKGWVLPGKVMELFEQIILMEEQVELLRQIAEAARNVPMDQRE
jgi:hypothetical protein